MTYRQHADGFMPYNHVSPKNKEHYVYHGGLRVNPSDLLAANKQKRLLTETLQDGMYIPVLTDTQ